MAKLFDGSVQFLKILKIRLQIRQSHSYTLEKAELRYISLAVSMVQGTSSAWAKYVNFSVNKLNNSKF